MQLGNGNGSFQAPQTFAFHSGADDSSFLNLTAEVQQFADLNKDGKLDLVLISQTSTFDNQIGGMRATCRWRSAAATARSPRRPRCAGPEIMARYFGETLPAPIVVADLDGDGIADLAMLGASASYSLQVATGPRQRRRQLQGAGPQPPSMRRRSATASRSRWPTSTPTARPTC